MAHYFIRQHFILANGYKEQLTSGNVRTVVFNVMHYGTILDIVNYRYVKHPRDTCFLLISGYWSNPRNRFIDNLEKNGIFSKVMYYDCSLLYNCDEREKLIKVIKKQFHDIESELGIKIKDAINYTYSELDDAFSIFAELNEIPVTHVRPYHLTDEILRTSYEELHRLKLISDAFYNLQKETMALGTIDNQVEFFFSDTLNKLSFFIKRKILRCTEGYVIPDKDTCLLLTNSIGLMKGAGIEESEVPFVYQLLLDYYLPENEKVMVKPHPHSPDYTICFDENMLVSKDINIEIMRYGRNKLKKTYAVCSMSSSKLRDICKETVEVGYGFFQHYSLLSIINDLVKSFGNSNYSFYQDFIEDTSFVRLLARRNGIDMDMGRLPIPDDHLKHSIVFSNCVGHTNNMDCKSDYSVIVIGDWENVEQKTRCCMQVEYQNKYMGNILRNQLTIFTNDLDIIERMSTNKDGILPYSHNYCSKKITRKVCLD